MTKHTTKTATPTSATPKSWMSVIAAATILAAPVFAAPAFAGPKNLPPAFGKELVPSESTAEQNESKSGELEDMKEETEEKAAVRSHRGGRVGRGGKIHIQLDGDEDGGGDDGLDGDF
jgi:hypothetical protein